MSDFFAHPSSFVDEGAQVGENTKIWHFCHIMPDAIIGQGCNIGQNVSIAPRVVVGNNVKIQNNVSLYSGVILEDDVFLGPSAVFTNVFNPRSHFPRRDQYLTTLIERGATIGANATIVCGITMGRYSFVGAGSVLTRDLPPYALAYGNPAKIHGWMCYCGEKLPFIATSPDDSKEEEAQESVACLLCERRYVWRGGAVTPLEAEIG